MNAPLISLNPDKAAQLLKQGRAILVDIREPDEFARRRAKGAVSRPVAAIDAASLSGLPDRTVIYTCRSGMRTAAHHDRLAAAGGEGACVLEGGLDAWTAAGLPVDEDRAAPLEIMRQVQIGAGVLVLIGVVLSLAVSPWFLAISALVGAGLTLAGVTGFCGMARLLALAPWNHRVA
jgi:rhodanese-related sulfurtransferase